MTEAEAMIGQNSEHRRPISLLVHIAFHFVPHRWQYLARVLAGLAEFKIHRLLVVVDSNTLEVSERIAALALPKHCTVRVDVHTNLAHPFDLTWAHRKDMASAIASFDYFMYLEDDIYVPWATFEAWLRRAESVSAKGFIHGFLRVEFDLAGNPISTDWRRSAKRPPTIEIEGVKYIRPEWFYQACWVYSQATLQSFVGTGAWTRGFHRWSSMIRGHRHSGAANYTREFSAFGMACATPGRPRVLLPVNDNEQILLDCWVYHLPNNYAQGTDLNLLDARRLIEGGLGGTQSFSVIDRTAETVKWASYLLHLNEGKQWARARAKRFLSIIKGDYRGSG
jgi:hypothetical protein